MQPNLTLTLLLPIKVLAEAKKVAERAELKPSDRCEIICYGSDLSGS